jgi:hypothetical protein
MSPYFARLAQRSGIEATTAQPRASEPTAPTSPAAAVSAALEQEIEVETPPARLDPADGSDSSERTVASVEGQARAAEGPDETASIRPAERVGRPSVEDRPHEARRPTRSRSEGVAAAARSSPMPERAPGTTAAEQWNAESGGPSGEDRTVAVRPPARSTPRTDRTMERETVRIVRQGAETLEFEHTSRHVDDTSRPPSSTTAEAPRPIVRPPPPDLAGPRRSAARSDASVEVHIGAITIEVSPPKPATPRTPPAPQERRDRFAPYRHYLRAW